LLGLGEGVFPVLLFSGVCLALYLFKNRVGDLWLRGIGLLLLSVAFAAATHFFRPGSQDGLPEGNGGLLGITAATFLQGHFGKVGGVAACELHDRGAKVIAVSDVSGGLHDANGLDIPRLYNEATEHGHSYLA
jgi:hypothetical protein